MCKLWPSHEKTQAKKAQGMVEENPDQIVDMVIDFAPPVIFCLLLLFAFLLKIVYINSDHFYTEHLVLAVHNHCFIYIAYIAVLLQAFVDLLPDYGVVRMVHIAILLWVPIYLFLSLRRLYGEGWFLTIIKHVLLFTSYNILFLIAALSAMIIGVITL